MAACCVLPWDAKRTCGQAAIAAIVLVKVIRCIRYGAKELTKCHDRIFIVLKWPCARNTDRS